MRGDGSCSHLMCHSVVTQRSDQWRHPPYVSMGTHWCCVYCIFVLCWGMTSSHNDTYIHKPHSHTHSHKFTHASTNSHKIHTKFTHKFTHKFHTQIHTQIHTHMSNHTCPSMRTHSHTNLTHNPQLVLGAICPVCTVINRRTKVHESSVPHINKWSMQNTHYCTHTQPEGCALQLPSLSSCVCVWVVG